MGFLEVYSLPIKRSFLIRSCVTLNWRAFERWGSVRSCQRAMSSLLFQFDKTEIVCHYNFDKPLFGVYARFTGMILEFANHHNYLLLSGKGC